FQILLQIGAGTGLLFILRWFWWRINAFSELTAMIVSFVVAVYLELLHPGLFPAAPLGPATKLLIGVGITTAAWVAVTFVTPPAAEETLRRFCALVRPGGPGWARVVRRAAADGRPLEAAGERWSVPQGILAMLAGSFAVYAALFAIGSWLYGRFLTATVLTVVAAVGAIYVVRVWGAVSRGAPEPAAREVPAR